MQYIIGSFQKGWVLFWAKGCMQGDKERVPRADADRGRRQAKSTAWCGVLRDSLLSLRTRKTSAYLIAEQSRDSRLGPFLGAI